MLTQLVSQIVFNLLECYTAREFYLHGIIMVEKKVEGFDIKDMNYEHAEIVQNFLLFEHERN
jgi:hypothetical protein